jgi:hypothetical protein
MSDTNLNEINELLKRISDGDKSKVYSNIENIVKESDTCIRQQTSKFSTNLESYKIQLADINKEINKSQPAYVKSRLVSEANLIMAEYYLENMYAKSIPQYTCANLV